MNLVVSDDPPSSTELGTCRACLLACVAAGEQGHLYFANTGARTGHTHDYRAILAATVDALR